MFYTYLFIYFSVSFCVCAHVCTMVHVWKPEDSSVELVLFLLSTLIRILGIEHKSPGLLASDINPLDILSATCLLFLKY